MTCGWRWELFLLLTLEPAVKALSCERLSIINCALCMIELYTSTQTENRFENRCSANTPPRPVRFSLMVASIRGSWPPFKIQRAIAWKFIELLAFNCGIASCVWSVAIHKTHCTTDEASSCIDVVLFRHFSHIGKNVICDWHTSNLHSVLGVKSDTWLELYSILNVCCRWRHTCVICFRGRNCDSQVARWSYHLAYPQQLILSIAYSDSRRSPLAHCTHCTSRPAKRVAHQGFHQLIKVQLWFHQLHGVSCKPRQPTSQTIHSSCLAWSHRSQDGQTTVMPSQPFGEEHFRSPPAWHSRPPAPLLGKIDGHCPWYFHHFASELFKSAYRLGLVGCGFRLESRGATIWITC